ncbi:hypothetical protein C8Q75DRAFT_739953 [Abortiporus biennis]|nr:hypothetical protein C8Q75DRAFT_739953 [Abortiporus biennis]
MSLNTHDSNIVLVAPRPVRLAAPTPYTQFNPLLQRPHARAAVRLVSAPVDAFEKLKLAEDVGEEENKTDSLVSSGRDSVSPRPSPRSTLPSEALEEFLSILRPSTTFLFQPTSPIIRSSNVKTASNFFPYRRSASCSLSPVMSSDGLGLNLLDQAEDKENDAPYPFRLIGSPHLSSPVARNLARNPFQRHPSYENPAVIHSGVSSPSPVNSAGLSPAAVPLPLPTPDEMDFEIDH